MIGTKGICCPHCGSASARIVESRPGIKKVRRRRECWDCGERYTTYEILITAKELKETMRHVIDGDKKDVYTNIFSAMLEVIEDGEVK